MKGWRTFSINLAVAAFGLLEAADWTAILGDDKAALVVTALAIANMILRQFTTTPIGRRR